MTDPKPQQHETGSNSTAGLVSPLWKYGAFVLGFGLVLAVGGNSGPASASAGVGGGEGELSVGGFGVVGDEPGLVIVDGDGARVGVLPMMAGD